jgi:hypothetical protein
VVPAITEAEVIAENFAADEQEYTGLISRLIRRGRLHKDQSSSDYE